MKQLQKFYPHLLAILGFIIISLLYFYPVLQGKKIYQHDIVQYTGMAKEQNDFRAEYDSEPYWTNASFGGMPTYQSGAKYPHDYIGKLDDLLRFLPRPADYLFLYFLGFYGLLLTLRINPLKAFFGALAFGLSTYLIVIIGVGHNAKAHAIAYMPLVIAGFILVFRKKYLHGGMLTMLAVALEITANHFQMTYYLFLLLIVMSFYFLYRLYQEKDLKALPKIIATFLIAVTLAVGANATSLMATKEYADFSIRGKSELTTNPDGTKKEANISMDREYITEYSYGVSESLNLISPRLFGGGNGQKLTEDSHVYNFMLEYGAQPEEAKEITESYGITYWGDQPQVAAPAYIGAIVFFLFVLALYHDKRKIKYAFLAGVIFSLLLSWGKNFSLLTDFFIDYVPAYDKFRAVSSIQVLLELCIPVLAIMGLQSFFTTDKEKQWSSLWKTAATSLGLIVVLFLAKGMFSFVGDIDSQLANALQGHPDKSFGTAFLEALREDRKDLYSADLLRSGFLMLVTFGALYLYTKNKLAQNTAVIIIGVFMVGDLFFVDKNYVSNDGKQFRSAREVDVPFEPTAADSLILADKSIFRVYELDGGLHSPRSSYFHKSVGGYSAVRPRRFEEVYTHLIEKSMNTLGENVDPKTLSLTKSIPVLDVFNIKYLIIGTEQGDIPVTNPFHNGNAWFVKELTIVNSADEELNALGKINTKDEAIIQDSEKWSKKSQEYIVDSLSTIKLDSYKPNHLIYNSNNSNNGFAVFSEIYYKDGWKATIDGKETEIFKVDYTLRGIEIPKGKHNIEFKFEPQVVKTGGTIALFSSIGMLLVVIGVVYFEQKGKKLE
ncbi:YfhO family protein [Flavobacterium sp. J49]|uniref:YfhO family protein n=1 Tax=Flavobacterium sp. J49 TaxID=2718534 RepID=UPI00159339A1|nr:YfhO family protein [Flavobacterium sp. J49]MBF6641022.1 YfhO family protein [Flavobacterium sp. J49]NIC02269.1 YfhO family protein [Flavobacterium sp. J49]